MALLWLPGLLLIIAVMTDLLASTLQGGEGRLTRLLQQGVCQLFSGLYRLTGRRGFLVWSGSVVILSTTAAWTLLLWLGWLLVFMSSPGAVLNGQALAPADFWGRVYFSGFAISTLGVGDYQAGGSLWRVLTAVASLNGFFLLTFAISFIIPVAQTQALRRRIALRLYRAGATVEGLLLRAHEEDERPLQVLLDDLVPDLVRLEQTHRNTPVLHRFHGPSREEAIELGIAALDEALTVLEFAYQGAKPRGLQLARETIGSYLETLSAAWVAPADDAPQAPPLKRLADAGMTLCDSERFEARLEQVSERRRLLRALVERSGWDWSQIEVTAPPDSLGKASV